MIIQRKELLAALDSCAAGLGTKGGMNQSQCYVFRNGKVHAYVPDCSDYLAAQLFFRECGFPDSRIDRKKDAIKFQRSSV
jgi:hypothetical protein